MVNLTFGVSLLMLGWFADRFGMANLYLLAALLTTVAVIVGLFSRNTFSNADLLEEPKEDKHVTI
ncbi:hypothetical protein C2W64_01441 [Brevibacillus laterosporus]|nr:hypothetical protein C2W64_01441 [Brevibacillus laterosporus]